MSTAVMGIARMRYHLLSTLALIVFVLAFAVHNARTVEILLLLWTFELPRSLLIFAVLLIGMVIGWFSRAMVRISRRGEGSHD